MITETDSIAKSIDLITDKKHRSQRERIVVLIIAAISYFVDSVWLFVYAYNDFVSFAIPFLYLSGSLIIGGFFYLLTVTGWNLKLKDPNMVIPQSIAGNIFQLTFLLIAPQIGLVFLLLIFVVSAFETLAMTVRQFIMTWFVVAVSTGIIMLSVGDKLGFPVATQNQQIIAWLVFISILARVIFINMQITGLRNALRSRNLKLKNSLKQIEELANTDYLTQVLNRRAFIKYAEEEILRARRNKTIFSLAIFDLDHFKEINDTYGHLVGDKVLVKTAEIVSQTIRTTDKFGRFGGEEFILLFPETSLSGCETIMKRIHENIAENDWEKTNAGLDIKISTGIACFNFDENLNEITVRADKALYQAKNAGRNCLRISQPI